MRKKSARPQSAKQCVYESVFVHLRSLGCPKIAVTDLAYEAQVEDILKSHQFQPAQGILYTADARAGIYHVIKRIRTGSFKGSDYVRFGTLSNIDFTQEINALDHTNSYSTVLPNAGGEFQSDQHPHL